MRIFKTIKIRVSWEKYAQDLGTITNVENELVKTLKDHGYTVTNIWMAEK